MTINCTNIETIQRFQNNTDLCAKAQFVSIGAQGVTKGFTIDGAAMPFVIALGKTAKTMDVADTAIVTAKFVGGGAASYTIRGLANHYVPLYIVEEISFLTSLFLSAGVGGAIGGAFKYGVTQGFQYANMIQGSINAIAFNLASKLGCEDTIAKAFISAMVIEGFDGGLGGLKGHYAKPEGNVIPLLAFKIFQGMAVGEVVTAAVMTFYVPVAPYIDELIIDFYAPVDASQASANELVRSEL